MRKIEHHLAAFHKTLKHDVIQDIQDNGMGAPFVMACIQTRTVPSDDDAIDRQLRNPAPASVVQVMPESVDV